MVIDYPDWFTALDRKRIEEARTTFGAQYQTDHGGGFIGRRRFRSDMDASAALNAIFGVVADILRGHPRDPKHNIDLIRLRDSLIVDVDQHRPKDAWPDLKTFAAVIAITTDNYFAAGLGPILQLTRSTRSRATFPRRAAWLKPLLRGLSPYMFHKQFAGPDAKVIRKILAGRPVNDDSLTKLVDALRDAGHRVTFEQIPRE